MRGPWKSELHTPKQALPARIEETGPRPSSSTVCVGARHCAVRAASRQGRQALPELPADGDPRPGLHAARSLRENTLQDLRLRPEDHGLRDLRAGVDREFLRSSARQSDHYKDLGFRIALDDTGVAYGSLEAVMELAPDFIKVDMSLVRSDRYGSAAPAS